MNSQDPLPPALALIACAMGDANPATNCRYRSEIEEALAGEAAELLNPFTDLWEAAVTMGDEVEPARMMARFRELKDPILRVMSGWETVYQGAWPEYLKQLRDDRRKREASYQLVKIKEAIDSGIDPSPSFASAAEKLELMGRAAAPPRDRKQLLRGFWGDLDARKKRYDAGQMTGIPTGITGLDRITDGLQPGEFSVLGARPNMGKTAFGISVLCAVAMQGETPTLLVSLESSAFALMRRLAACYAGANASDLKRGNIGPWMKQLTMFQHRFQSAPITMLDNVENPEVMNIDGLVSAARLAVRRSGVKLIIVDYLQKVRATGEHDGHHLAVAEVSEKLARLGQSTGAHVLALAQLKREAEGKERAPIMSDLAESGHIERDADLIMLLHRECRTLEDAEIIVAKQRDGELDLVPIHFDLKRQRIQSARRDGPDHSPK